MNQLTINRFEHDLRCLEERLRFTPGQTLFDREGEVFLQGRPRATPDDPNRYRITLGRNMRATADVQRLPCSLIGADGAIAAATWTNDLGQADFSLAAGEYALRCVWNVQDAIDAEILATLGDDLAIDYLKNCLEDEELPVPLRQRVQAVLESLCGPSGGDGNVPVPLFEPAQSDPFVLEIARLIRESHQANDACEDIAAIPALVLRTLAAPRYAKLRCDATVGAEVQELAGHAACEPPCPAVAGDWIEIQGDEVVLNIPQKDVPYGVVRVFAQAEDSLLGTCLVPLVKYSEERGSTLPAYRVVRDRNPRSVTWHVQAATLEYLPWFPAAQVEALLQWPEVKDDEELQARVRELLELVRKQSPEGSHD